ncbi:MULTISPECIES: glutathione S-transferase [Methylobacterium]|jgi:glutathione S-transferase|uniref:glutathione transferase n=3 Tax=Methylobacterium TaxID=407 RepID=A0AAE8L7B6_9HYPH|nr:MULTISPECIES: glutathione S-transferase [Methylobacterium]KOX60399.1 glutathione S-transferase [Streptomyces purpurogeneiscleroticus]AIQ90510.1 Glutathione S-transferase domain protein [Methylobacterium oryzae CBMB20]APT31236.1 glutathione S-transferase 3 [Methylobacterium phyllosphaerae]AWV17350.1 glutathione S-transferase [Methylobacterium sp. XJLW]MBA9065796.1 glutathione S-transferase [Methylobacterium fujisawaense]
MITVHHLENSRSQRVLWLLEELGLPYRVTRYARDPRTLRAPPELVAVHPLGKAPVITDGETVVAETGAIVAYLTELAGARLVPEPGTEARRRYVYWSHYAEGSAMPPLLLKLVFGRLAPSSPWLLRPLVRRIADTVLRGFVDPDLRRHAAFWEAELADRPYFCGTDFSAADILMSFPLEAFAARGTGTGPQVTDWLARIHTRPAYQRALQQGGPYAYA